MHIGIYIFVQITQTIVNMVNYTYLIYKNSLLFDIYSKGHLYPSETHAIWTPVYEPVASNEYDYVLYQRYEPSEEVYYDDYVQTTADIMTVLACYLFCVLIADFAIGFG